MKRKKIIAAISIITGLYLISSAVQSLLPLMNAGTRIENAQKKLLAAQKDNEELKKRLMMVQSPEFMEEEAREKLNLAKEGETIVILPSSIPLIQTEKVIAIEDAPNWKKWYTIFFEDVDNP